MGRGESRRCAGVRAAGYNVSHLRKAAAYIVNGQQAITSAPASKRARRDLQLWICYKSAQDQATRTMPSSRHAD